MSTPPDPIAGVLKAALHLFDPQRFPFDQEAAARILNFLRTLATKDDVGAIRTQLYRLEQTLGSIQDALASIQQQETQMQADLTALQQAVTEEETVQQSAITLIQGLAAQLTQLASQPTVNPADLEALAARLNAAKQAMADAIVANTPAAP